jgi:hydrogenase maturation protease
MMQMNKSHDKIKASLAAPMQKIDQYGMLSGGCNGAFVLAGNDFRSDDGVGPYIAEALVPIMKDLSCVQVYNTRTNPENYIDEVAAAAPKIVVFLDAANFGGITGEFIIIEDETVFSQGSASTHTIPLGIIANLIKSKCGCDVMYIGIQAQRLQLGEGLSDDVKIAADMLIEAIKTRLNGE